MSRTKNKSKKKTHKVAPPDSTIPRSFVVKKGEASSAVSQLVKDTRQIMEPNTATNLKERKSNKVKDFLMIAGQLMVSHLLVFSKSGNGGVNLRIGRIPRGPTITFHVESYSLIKDVLALQARPKSPGHEYQTSPLVVLNNFSSKEIHVQLMAAVLQNMFPAIKVTKMKLSDAKRVVLFTLNSETNLVELRHYRITVKNLGISKSVKSIIQTKVPDLSGFDDISDYIMKASFASESDAEDATEASFTLPGLKDSEDVAPEKRAIKLFELGPRLDLKLIKIQSGLCGGAVIHHEFVQKSEEEVKELASKKEAQRVEKDARRKQQERNVKSKMDKAPSASENNDDLGQMDKDDDELDYDEEDFEDLMMEEDE